VTTTPPAVGDPAISTLTGYGPAGGSAQAGSERSRVGARIGTGLALTVVGLSLLSALFPALLAIHNPSAINLSAVLTPPSWAHPMGTDEFGRDIASRIVYGARPVLLTSLLSVAIGGLSGSLLGIVSGFVGGPVDLLLMRAVDLVMVFPSLLLALTLVTAFGTSLDVVTIAIGLSLLPVYARLMRSEVLRVRQEGYIDAARWIGASRVRTIATHILPNVAPSLLVLSTFTVGSAVLIASALSFLGLGVGGTTPDWGLMLANGQEYITQAWWDVTMPGLAITVLVLSVNVLGDRVRDRLDPQTGSAVQAARRGMLLGNRWGRR
jgi:peptide/nickel transport system permease protein